MKKTNKKAFTIVELVIVIAIIAVLAAVLIPTFSGVVKKAKISADVQLAKNMNTALTLAEVTDGKNKTFFDAIADIQEAGYTVDKLTPTSEKCSLVWDQDADRIVFFDENDKIIYSENDVKNEKSYHLWKVAHKTADISSKFSNYLANNFTGGIPAEITTGLDVGNIEIASITYKRLTGEAQDVIIRTNGGILTINAPNDSITHYGTALTVNVNAVAMSSWIEFGKILGNINLKIGHLKLASTADVGVVQVAPEATNVKLTGESGATLGTLDINPSNNLSSSALSLNLSGVECSSIVTNGVVSNPTIEGTTKMTVVLSSEERANAGNFSGGLGTETSPYIVSNETQLATMMEATSGYYLVGLDVTVSANNTFNDSSNIHIIIDGIGSLKVESSGTLTVSRGSSLVVNGEVIIAGSVTILGEFTCNGNVTVVSNGTLQLGDSDDATVTDALAQIVIGENGVCKVNAGKIIADAKVFIYGVLDLTTVPYDSNGLVPNHPGKIFIMSTGTFYMLEDFQYYYEPNHFNNPGDFIGQCETSATIIYADGGNTAYDGTYIYDGTSWVKQ